MRASGVRAVAGERPIDHFRPLRSSAPGTAEAAMRWAEPLGGLRIQRGGGPGDLGLDVLLDQRFAHLEGGADLLEQEPLRQRLAIGDLHRWRQPAAADAMQRQLEARRAGLEPAEHRDQGDLQPIGAGAIGGGQLGDALGLGLLVGHIGAELLDHEAPGIGLLRQGLTVVRISLECLFQLGDGPAAHLGILGIEQGGEGFDADGQVVVFDPQRVEADGRRQGRRTCPCRCGGARGDEERVVARAMALESMEWGIGGRDQALRLGRPVTSMTSIGSAAPIRRA